MSKINPTQIRTLLVSPFLLLLFSIFVSSCDNEDGPHSSSWDFKYPLEIGNEWNYKRTHKTFYYESPQSDIITDSIITTDYHTVKVVGYEILNEGQPSIKVTSNDYENELEAVQYYSNEENGLYSIAYNIYGAATFAKSDNHISPYMSIFPGAIEKNLKNVNADSLYYDTPPTTIMKYPIKVGDKWIFREFPISTLFKEVKKKNIVNVEAGTFNCFRFDYAYPDNSDFNIQEFYDNISKEGLIERYYKTDKITFLDIYGNGAVSSSSSESYELLSFILN